MAAKKEKYERCSDCLSSRASSSLSITSDRDAAASALKMADMIGPKACVRNGTTCFWKINPKVSDRFKYLKEKQLERKIVEELKNLIK